MIRRYFLPLAAMTPIVIAIGILTNLVLPCAGTDWQRAAVYVVACSLTVLGAISVQALLASLLQPHGDRSIRMRLLPSVDKPPQSSEATGQLK